MTQPESRLTGWRLAAACAFVFGAIFGPVTAAFLIGVAEMVIR